MQSAQEFSPFFGRCSRGAQKERTEMLPTHPGGEKNREGGRARINATTNSVAWKDGPGPTLPRCRSDGQRRKCIESSIHPFVGKEWKERNMMEAKWKKSFVRSAFLMRRACIKRGKEAPFLAVFSRIPADAPNADAILLHSLGPSRE